MLTITGLSKKFNAGTVNEKVAIQNLNLQVNQGDFITIVGSNGAGKSTLFNAIAGTFLADSGKIILNNKNITFLPAHVRSKYIGQLFQDPLKGTAPHMTIEENLTLAYLRAGKNTNPFSRISKEEKEFFYQQLKMLDMGLEERMKTPVGTLSGGQRQALTLLMATIVPPEILLLDEHTAALDPKAAEKIMKLTNEIVARNHTTCLMVTHNLHQAITTGNRTLMMADGSIVLDIQGEKRAKLTIPDLMEMFKNSSGKDLDNDRILLSN